jgi:hypothetical protein
MGLSGTVHQRELADRVVIASDRIHARQRDRERQSPYTAHTCVTSDGEGIAYI